MTPGRTRQVVVVFLAATAWACRGDGSSGRAAPVTRPSVEAPLSTSTPARDAQPGDAPRATDAASAPRDGAAAALDTVAFTTAAPTWGKSIGHTSVVFKLRLAGGFEAAYKPRSKRGAGRYKGEIAAYRLGVALGLPNVPPAMPRTFSYATLLAALGGKDSDAGALLVDEAVTDEAGRLPGAIIPWIPRLGFLALEKDPLLSQWKGWLGTTDDVPEDKRSLAAQISTLIVFDYLTGNWDRWSGENVGFDSKQGMVLFIDNDGAFYDTPPPGPLASQRRRLEAVTRFSRGFVASLRRLDAGALRAAMGEEAAGAPLLGPRSLAGVAARRDEALRLIDRLVARLGEAKVLAFD
jgi:hypothetical protein